MRLRSADSRLMASNDCVRKETQYMSNSTTLTVANKQVSERFSAAVLEGCGCVVRDGGDAV